MLRSCHKMCTQCGITEELDVPRTGRIVNMEGHSAYESAAGLRCIGTGLFFGNRVRRGLPQGSQNGY